MRIKQALRRRDDAKLALVSMFGTARHFGLPHNDMLTRRADILARYKINESPSWVGAYLNGWWDCLSQSLYHDALIFGGFVNGKFYSTHSNRVDYYERHGIEPREFSDDGLVTERGHYWADSLRPFFVSNTKKEKQECVSNTSSP